MNDYVFSIQIENVLMDAKEALDNKEAALLLSHY